MIEWIEDFWKIAFENKSQQNILTENKKKWGQKPHKNMLI